MIYAATGHRPDKLGGFNAATDKRLFTLAVEVLSNYGLQRPTEGVSGMALGWDMAFAEACIELDIPLTIAIPFKNQELQWSDAQQGRYADIWACATTVHIVSEGDFAAWKYMARNTWMVERADLMLALWDGSEGGTHHCIKEAEKFAVPVTNLWTAYERMWR